MQATLEELASRFACRVSGDASTVIRRVATLEAARPDAISFLANPLYRSALATTAAGAVILNEAVSAECPVPCLISDNPYARYAEIAAYLHPAPAAKPGVHPSASIDPGATIHPGAEVGAQAVVGPSATLGDGVVVGAGSVIAAGVRIGAGTRLAPRVSLLEGVQIGERCVIHSGVVIGGDGFGFASDQGRWIKVPQLGGVRIGNDVEIGANTTIDRGTIEDTVIEDGVKLDNLIQIAHNVHVGEHTVMAAMSGAAGSTRIGKRCMVGGGVVMVGHLTICDDVMFTFRSVVTRSVTEPGTWGGSLPAEEASKWRRNAARFRQLDAMQERLTRLARQIKQLTGTKNNDD